MRWESSIKVITEFESFVNVIRVQYLLRSVNVITVNYLLISDLCHRPTEHKIIV
jgi:hypothetical protein